MSVWKSVRDFSVGILKRFYVWLPAVVLDPFDLYDRYVKPSLPDAYRLDFTPPPSVFFFVLMVLLALAAILTYHDLNRRYADVTSRLDGMSARELAAVDEIGRLRSVAIRQLLNRRVKSDADLQEWVQAEAQWSEEVLRVLGEYFPRAVVHRFTDLGTLSASTFVGSYNDAHNHQRLMLKKRLDILEGLLEQYTRR